MQPTPLGQGCHSQIARNRLQIALCAVHNAEFPVASYPLAAFEMPPDDSGDVDVALSALDRRTLAFR